MNRFLLKTLVVAGLLVMSVSSCHVYVDGQIDEIDKRLQKLENTTIASVNTQMLNITNSIPEMEQTCSDLESYITLVKKENISGLSTPVSSLEKNLNVMTTQVKEMKIYAESLSEQGSVDNEKWMEITLNTLNLYQTLQNTLSTVKVDISNITNTINEIGVQVDQKILDFSVSITAVISQTEVKMMEWVNNSFTAYYTIAETNAQINNLIVENNVEINSQINALSLQIVDINTQMTTLYESVINETINHFSGSIQEYLVQQINEANVNLDVTINDIKARITDIDNRITVINNTINTVNEQVTAINVSIDQLNVLNQQINQYITVLQQEGDTYKTQIEVLQNITNNINVQITNLDVYVKKTVNELTVNINDTKVWVTATFATIEQYNIINTTIINVQAAVTLVQADILTINNSITNINTNITNVQNNVNVTIQDLDKSTREWVNKMLGEYMTASEVKKEIAWLQIEIEKLQGESETADADLEQRLSALENEFEKTQTDQTEAIKEAVEKAITDHDGDVSSELQNLAGSISKLEDSVQAIAASISNIQNDIYNLEDGLKDAKYDINTLIKAVQSIEVIPSYSDGSVAVEKGATTLQFEILPLSAAQNLVSYKKISKFSFDVLEVATKAGSDNHPLQNLQVSAIRMNGDFLEVDVDCAVLDSTFFKGEKALMGRLKISDYDLEKSSGYFPLYYAGGETQSGETPEMVDMGLSVKWASFNLGATKPEEYGRYYAWGDVTGQTWNGTKWSGSGFSTETEFKLNSNDLSQAYDAAYVNLGGKWRMPTKAECQELIGNCTSTWTDNYNGTGVAGRIFTSNKAGYTDKSIFLPAAGYGYNNNFVSGLSLYWSSTYLKDPYAYALAIYYEGIKLTESSFSTGNPVRPVYGDYVTVKSISLSKISVSLNIGSTEQLTVSHQPADASYFELSWTSSDSKVATVSSDGLVSAVGAGSCTITATTTNGVKAECSVTVAKPQSEMEYVDLGLSVKWASCNLGATSSEQKGDQYAWGETDVYDSSKAYKWTTDYKLTKYCPSDKTDYWYNYAEFTNEPDDKWILDEEDDAAHVKLGGNWRIPTRAEMQELVDECTWTAATENEVSGYRVTSKKPGYTDKSIFLPNGAYSASTLSNYGNYPTRCFALNSSNLNPKNERTSGYLIRPVNGASVPVEEVSMTETTLNMKAGATYALSASITPSNASEDWLIWSSSDESVATVSGDGVYENYPDEVGGVIYGVKEGECTIRVKSLSGGVTDSCKVVVTSASITKPVYVDLGLSVKWATFNVGASRPEDYGLCYAWGETEPRTESTDWKSYKWCNGSLSTLTKYCRSFNSKYWYNYSEGSNEPDDKTVLDASDDVANVKFGGSWRIPTVAEWTELQNSCTWTWTRQNGIGGMLVTSNKTGYTDKSIFLPASRVNNVRGDYWSSSISDKYPYKADEIYFSIYKPSFREGFRYEILSVRPVTE